LRPTHPGAWGLRVPPQGLIIPLREWNGYNRFAPEPLLDPQPGTPPARCSLQVYQLMLAPCLHTLSRSAQQASKPAGLQAGMQASSSSKSGSLCLLLLPLLLLIVPYSATYYFTLPGPLRCLRILHEAPQPCLSCIAHGQEGAMPIEGQMENKTVNPHYGLLLQDVFLFWGGGKAIAFWGAQVH